jgi:prolycopene isomerase
MDYDIVIIGAGISGLSLGALLGKAGFNCCIVEKEYHAGGYIAGYSRKDFHFDTAIHWLNQFGKSGIVHKVFNSIDSDYPKPTLLNKIHRYKSDNYDILLQNNIQKVKADFIKQFPEEEKGIELFFKHAEELSRVSLRMNDFVRNHESMGVVEKAIYYTRMLPHIFPIFKHLKYANDEGVRLGLSKYFKGDEIKDVFSSERDLLSCLFPLAWAKITDYYKTPSGGSVQYVNWLVSQNERFGNKILLSSEATEVLLQGNVAKGIKVKNKNNVSEIYSKYVIAASDLPYLYRKLLPDSAVSEKVKSKLENSIQYTSSFTVSVALDCPAEDLGFGEELISLSKNNIQRSDHEGSDPKISKLSIIAPSVRDKSVCPDDKGIITIYMAADIEKFDFWHTEIGDDGKRKRGKAYREFKKQIAEIIIDRITELSPEFREHIMFYEASTPFTYQRYSYNYRGTMMGPRPGKENMQNKVASHYTEVRNLLVGGQWAELGGGVPIAVRSAVNTTLIILRKENKKKYRLLAKYMDGKISVNQLNTKF